MNQPPLTSLESTIGYQFKDIKFLEVALTHRSSLNEPAVKESNERLEFLGDAVLELVITSFLFEAKPNDPEGVLTAARSAIVRTESLSQIAKSLKLGEYLHMSKGEVASGGRENPSILEDSFEALTGAIFKDGGLEAAKIFLEKFVFPVANEVIAKNQLKDPKSLLQEKVQSTGSTSPIYQTVSESGPDHQKIFTVAVVVDGQEMGTGTGKSKQEAEQIAAKAALDRLNSPAI